MKTLTLISGQWMPSRLRFPLLLLLPLILLGPSFAPGKVFAPLLPVTQEPLAAEHPGAAMSAGQGAHRVATDRIFPALTDELEIQRQLRNGTLPTWNPFLGIGVPLAGGSMVAPWNPLRWPFLWMDPLLASALHALLSMMLAGLGMMMFLEGRGLKFTAAFLGAVAFQGSGFLVANLHYIMKVDALLWAPWCLWGVDMIYRGRRNAGLLLCLGLGLSGLAGFPPVFVFVAFLTLAWIFVRAFEAIREERESERWMASLATNLAFAGLGCCVAAVYLLPMVEAAEYSARKPQAPHAIQAQSLPPAALVSLVLPMAFGFPGDLHTATEDMGTWWWLSQEDFGKGLDANRLEWHLFAGVTALALALGALLKRPRESLFPLAAVLLAWAFVFDGPGLSLLYGLPGLNFGAPARAAGIAALGIAWLAALGFDSLLEGHRSARVGTLLGGLIAGAFGLWTWASVDPTAWGKEFVERLPADLGPDLGGLLQVVLEFAALAGERVSSGGLQLALSSGGVLLLAYFAGRVTVRGGGTFGCLLLLLEVGAAGLPHVSPSSTGGAETFPPSEMISAIAEVAGDGRVLRLDQSPSGIGEVLQLARPNMLSAYGIGDLTPYTVLPSAPMRELWAALDPGGLFRTGFSRLSNPNLLDRSILDALRVTCVLSLHELKHPRLVQRFHGPSGYVYERTGAFPPGRLVSTRTTNEDTTLERLVSTRSTAPPGAGGSARLQFERPAADHIDVTVQGADLGSTLLIHEGWMPDWTATVDGEPVRTRRLDHVFFGVDLPQGDSTVHFRYEPKSLRHGAGLSLAALLAALLLTYLRRRRSPTPLSAAGQHASPSSW